MRTRKWSPAMLGVVLLLAPVALLGRGAGKSSVAAQAAAAQAPAAQSAAATQAGGRQKGGVGDIVGPYQLPDPKWPAWSNPYAKAGYTQASQGGVFAESPDRIYFANRGELKLPDRMPPFLPAQTFQGPGVTNDGRYPGYWGIFGLLSAVEPIANMVNIIVVVDGSGKVLETWNQWDKLFEFGRGPHSIYISPYDPERRVWVVDDFRHAIFVFSHDGKQLLQTLGVPGEWGDNNDPERFYRPTAIDWFKDGSFLVADGYSNTRIIKFDRTGKRLMQWGTRGRGPGQLRAPHGIAISGSGDRVYVADRDNARIQVFDADGKYIEEWPGVRANHLMVSADDQSVWASDLAFDRMVQYDRNGYLLQAWGQVGQRPGYTWCPHQFSADSDGNLYIAECFNGRQTKFVPKPGVDPARLVRPRPLMPLAGFR